MPHSKLCVTWNSDESSLPKPCLNSYCIAGLLVFWTPAQLSLSACQSSAWQLLVSYNFCSGNYVQYRTAVISRMELMFLKIHFCLWKAPHLNPRFWRTVNRIKKYSALTWNEILSSVWTDFVVFSCNQIWLAACYHHDVIKLTMWSSYLRSCS